MRKDLGICLDEADRNGARLPVTALVDQFYAQVVARGGRRWDTSSLVYLLQEPGSRHARPAVLLRNLRRGRHEVTFDPTSFKPRVHLADGEVRGGRRLGW